MMKTPLLKLFILVYLLFSCSRIDLAANWADTYISSQLDKYFDINNIQSQFIKKNLKEDIKSIKRILFPRAADELEKVFKETDEVRTYNRDLILAHEKVMKSIFYDALKIFEHSATGFASQLSPEQLNAFKKEFKDKTGDIQKMLNNPVESREKRYEKIRKFIEGWIGNLTNSQKTELRNFCQLNIFPYREQIMNREKLSKGFYDVFDDQEKRKQYVSDLFLNYESLRDPVYATAVNEDQDKLINTIVKIVNEMTEDQRNNLRSTLKDRIQQLRDSAEGKKRGIF
jgi:hypothetical protein